MKPKTKVEKEISRLSGSLRRLSQAQYDWAIKNVVKHFAWVNPTETRCYCTHCGKRVPIEAIQADVSEAVIDCPSCGAEIKKSYQRRGVKECFYFVVLTVHKDWQVNRYYEVRMDWAVKSGAKYYVREVMRKWYRPHQKEITQGVGINMMSYSCRSPYSLWSRMTIKKGEWRGAGYHTEWMHLKVYPRWKTLPVYRKCGFDGKPFDNDVQQTFSVILSNPYLEQLYKQGKYQEIRDIPPDARKHITDMYPSIRTAVRHKYDIKAVGMTPVVCEKGYRNRPLTDEQKAENRRKSKVRCRIEHVFGFMEGAMGGLVVRSVGLARAKANVALTCLVYNVFRYIQIRRYHDDWIAVAQSI